MRLDVDRAGGRSIRLAASPIFNECEKLRHRGIVENVGESEPNVKLLLNQRDQARRGE